MDTQPHRIQVDPNGWMEHTTEWEFKSIFGCIVRLRSICVYTLLLTGKTVKDLIQEKKKMASPLSQMHPPKIQFCDIYTKRSAINMLARSAFRAWRTTMHWNSIWAETKLKMLCSFSSKCEFKTILWFIMAASCNWESQRDAFCTMDRGKWWAANGEWLAQPTLTCSCVFQFDFVQGSVPL